MVEQHIEANMMRKREFLLALASTLAVHAVLPAAAQDYPARPITIVVPFPAGGPTDAVGRIVAERMRTSLGQSVIVENVGGAGGSLGIGRVARATPDGYTIALGIWSTQVVNAAIYALSYDVVKDFEPIALLASSPVMIAGKKTLPANNLNELIAWLKANPDKATQGTAGVGTPDHVAGVLFQQLTGTRYQFVHYRGSAPAMQDLVAGHIDLCITSPVLVVPQLRSGSIKAYVVTTESRLSSAPAIPTAAEAGIKGFQLSVWLGFFAPKGTPKAIVDKLNAAAVEALAVPEVRARFADFGLELFPREQETPAALGALQESDIEKWWPIIKAAGIKAE
jgi:tripartite-type tricarboxylate transporter receptor subunit TctC